MLVEIALVALAAVGLLICLALLPRSPAPPKPAPARRRPARPEQLARLERLLIMARTSALEVHAYLRPVLVEIAARRLASRGHRLEQMPAPIGRDVLGDQLWELVRPDRPFPEQRHAPGISAGDLHAALEALERL